jgi:hypothetical protein
MPKEDVIKFRRQEQKDEEPTAASTRKLSGPIPGGRAVDRVIQYTERRGGQAFTLRVNFDFDKSSDGDKYRIVNELRRLLKRFEAK